MRGVHTPAARGIITPCVIHKRSVGFTPCQREAPSHVTALERATPSLAVHCPPRCLWTQGVGLMRTRAAWPASQGPLNRAPRIWFHQKSLGSEECEEVRGPISRPGLTPESPPDSGHITDPSDSWSPSLTPPGPYRATVRDITSQSQTKMAGGWGSKDRMVRISPSTPHTSISCHRAQRGAGGEEGRTGQQGSGDKGPALPEHLGVLRCPFSPLCTRGPKLPTSGCPLWFTGELSINSLSICATFWCLNGSHTPSR